jgi:hypothetical protein
MSSFSSVLRYPRFDSYVQIHDWQLAASDNHKAAAALLNIFEVKHQAIVENKEFDREIREAAAAAGLTMPPDFKFWFAFTDKELLRRVKIAEKEAIYKGIDILAKKGFIQTEPPAELKEFLKTGRRKWFRFRADRVQPFIDDYDKKLWGDRPKASDTPNLPAQPEANVPETLVELEKQAGAPLMTQAREVFDDWRKLISPRSVEDPKRLKLAVILLKMGIEKERLFLATRGVLMRPHNLGATDGRKHIGFDLIFRDAAHFESYESTALDAGLTTENFRDYEITLKNPRLRRAADVAKERERAEANKPKSGAPLRAESVPSVYKDIGGIIADGIAVLEPDEMILNAVARSLSADDFFIRERLLEAVRVAASSRAPLDGSGKQKAERIVGQLIDLQKGL